MLIEPLDARRLYARTYSPGRDTTFADDGHLSFVQGFRAGYSLSEYFGGQPFASGSNGATFVSGSNGNQPQVAKFLADGRIDTSFGNNGYANIPYEATRLVYDDRNAFLYVASRGVGRKYDVFEANLTRLRVKGRIDKSFAGTGTFNYSLAVGDGEAARAAAVIDAINPLADGSVLIGVDRSTTDPDTHDTDQSLALIKIRADGLRDRRYGTNGIVQLLGGTVQGEDEAGGYPDSRKAASRGVFSDVRTNRNGVTSVLIRYGVGYALGSYESLYNDDTPDEGVFTLKSRRVSTRGVSDETQAYSWALGTTGSKSDPYNGLYYVGQESDGVVAIVSDGSSNGLVRRTFLPGQRGTREALPDLGIDPIYALDRSANGTYVVSTDDQIIRLRKNFTRDRTFADNGVATPGFAKWFGNYYVDSPYIDPFGRVLAFEGLGVLERFD